MTESLFQDLKHSLRMLRQNPGFAATALAALTRGIGTNTAIFSVVNTVLLKPVRAPDPDRVVVFMATNGGGSGSRASEIKFNIWREQASVFQDVSGYYFGSVNLTGVDRSQRTDAIFVTTDYFHLFGLPIAQGRGFTAEEERPNGPHVVVLSDAFLEESFWWQSQHRRQDRLTQRGSL